jgi:hypothetical protein
MRHLHGSETRVVPLPLAKSSSPMPGRPRRLATTRASTGLLPRAKYFQTRVGKPRTISKSLEIPGKVQGVGKFAARGFQHIFVGRDGRLYCSRSGLHTKPHVPHVAAWLDFLPQYFPEDFKRQGDVPPPLGGGVALDPRPITVRACGKRSARAPPPLRANGVRSPMPARVRAQLQLALERRLRFCLFCAIRALTRRSTSPPSASRCSDGGRFG